MSRKENYFAKTLADELEPFRALLHNAELPDEVVEGHLRNAEKTVNELFDKFRNENDLKLVHQGSEVHQVKIKLIKHPYLGRTYDISLIH